MIGAITNIGRNQYEQFFGESYGLEDLTSVPTIMVLSAGVWFFIAGLFGLVLPAGQFIHLGPKPYYISLTAHGAAMAFPFLFQFMVGVSLLRAGGCLGKPVRGRLPLLTYVFLNVGALLLAASILLGVRWSYVLMFPLPVVGTEMGLWSQNMMIVGFTGILLVLISVVILYPAQLIRMLFFGEERQRLLLEPRKLTDPGMLGMSLALLVLVPMGLPIVLDGAVIGLGLYGLVPMEAISWFTEPVVFQYFFWIFAHNLMEAMGLMAIGATYAIIPLYTADGSQQIYSTRLANAALIIIAISAMTAFFHHLMTTFPAQPAPLSYHGNIVSWLTGIGAALSIFTVLGTIWKHGLRPEPGALAILAGFSIYILDGAAAVIISNVRWNFQLHGTMWAGGHAMTILISLTLIWMGVLYHYYPVLTNRKLDRKLGNIHVALTTIGALGMFYTFMISGVDGVPRRIHSWWAEGWLIYAIPLTVFGLLFALGQFVFAKNIFGSREIDIGASSDADTVEAD